MFITYRFYTSVLTPHGGLVGARLALNHVYPFMSDTMSYNSSSNMAVPLI